jgi:hypothetical protein
MRCRLDCEDHRPTPALVGGVPANWKLFFLVEANQIGKVDSIELDGFFTLLRRKTIDLFETQGENGVECIEFHVFLLRKDLLTLRNYSA